MKRGVLYLVWKGPPGLTGCGQVGYDALLDRSVASVRKHLPGVPFRIVECDPQRGLLNKTQMGRITPFESTLFLDADTVVLGDLGHAWRMAEKHGLACCIGQCPWLRRYGSGFGDSVEYNTGVLFWTEKAQQVFSRWEELGPDSPPSRFLQGDMVCGLECDDQWAFSKAVEEVGFNPYVLPKNYNLMPGWDTRFFAPVKVWHSIHPVPPNLEEMSACCTMAGELIRFCELTAPRAGG